MNNRVAVKFRAQGKNFVKFFTEDEDNLMSMFIRTLPKVEGYDRSSLDFTDEDLLGDSVKYYNIL